MYILRSCLLIFFLSCLEDTYQLFWSQRACHRPWSRLSLLKQKHLFIYSWVLSQSLLEVVGVVDVGCLYEFGNHIDCYMRVNRIFVKEAASLREYAYAEEKNESFRHEMEDSTCFYTRLRRRRQPHFRSRQSLRHPRRTRWRRCFVVLCQEFSQCRSKDDTDC